MCSRPSRGSTVGGSERVDDTISKLLNTLGGTNTICNSVRRNSGRIQRPDNRPTGNVHLKNIDKMVHSLRNGTQVSYKRVTRTRTLSVRDRAQLAIKKIDRLVMSLSKPGTTDERVRAVGATPRQLEDFHTQDTPAKQQRITECVREASKTSKPCTNHPGSIQQNVTLTKPEAVVKCVKDDIKIRKSSLCQHEEIKKPKTVSELQTEVERINAPGESSKSSPNLLERTHTLAKPDSVIERIRRFEEIMKPCTRRLEGIQTDNKIPSPKTCVLKVRDDESFLTPTPSRLEEIGQKDIPQNNVSEDNKGSFENEPDLAKDDVKNRTWKILSSSCLVGALVVAVLQVIACSHLDGSYVSSWKKTTSAPAFVKGVWFNIQEPGGPPKHLGDTEQLTDQDLSLSPRPGKHTASVSKLVRLSAERALE
ncbi:hypothetical protein ScPMuIL_004283 [Solemya velum]